MAHIDAMILGIVEGITEFLPVSSTGHLIVAEQWLGARSDTFNIVIQAGAILAVTIVYWRRILELAAGWRQTENRLYIAKLATAFFITGVLGLIVKARGFVLPESAAPVALALIVGGLWMFFAEWAAARRPSTARITWTAAILVGVAQVVAGVFPGTSRSAATIFIAMLAGAASRAAATEFAFLVGIPTMYAASAWQILEQFRDGGGGGEDWTALCVAFAVSTATAFIAVKWLLSYILKHRFTVFAVYRIALGAVILIMGAQGQDAFI